MAKLIGRRQGLDQKKLAALEKILKEVGINQQLRINSGLRDHAEVFRIYNSRLQREGLDKVMPELPKDSADMVKQMILKVDYKGEGKPMKIVYPVGSIKKLKDTLKKQLQKDGVSKVKSQAIANKVVKIRSDFGGFASPHLRGEKIDIDRKLLRRPEVIDKMVEKGYVILDEISDEATGRGIFDISFPKPGRKGSYKRAGNKLDLSGPEMLRDDYLDDQRGVEKRSFKEAFDEARSMGQKEFNFKGRRFNTRMEGESPEEFEEKFKFVDDQKFDSPEEFERSKDEDIAIEQKKIIEEAKQPEQEIEADDVKLEQTIPMDQSVPFGVFAQGQPEFEMAEEQEKDKLMMAAEGGEVNPRIPRKKGQPAKSKKHSDLYTDEDPVGTIQGLGFKDVSTAKASVSKIRKSSRSHAHKVQAAVAMEQRAREMGKTSEAAVYRKFIDQMKEKTKKMAKAEGGEVNYQNGGEVNVPQFLRRPEDDMQEEEFKIQDVTQMDVEEPDVDPEVQDLETRPDPFPKRDRSPDMQGVREFQLSQMDTRELLDKKVPGQPQEPAVTRELSRRKKEFGLPLKKLSQLEQDQKPKVDQPPAKVRPPVKEDTRRYFRKLFEDSELERQKIERDLRKKEDEILAIVEKPIDPKRLYKNMGTFDKIVAFLGLAAGAYDSYKYGSPNLYRQRLNKAIDDDIREQQLDRKEQQYKKAQMLHNAKLLANRLGRATKDRDRKSEFLKLENSLDVAYKKQLRGQNEKVRKIKFIETLNKRGLTSREVAYADSIHPDLKVGQKVIKGRDGLFYYTRGDVKKLKEYISDAQDSIDGLAQLEEYVDKVSIFEQIPGASIISKDAAGAQSLRDRLVGKLRIEFFGPGVMTDQEREQAKKILGNPNKFFSRDSVEKEKIRNLLLKINYGIRQKLRRDGLAIPESQNDRMVKAWLRRERKPLTDSNKALAVNALIKAEKKHVENGGRPGKHWMMDEPLPI